MRAAQQTPRSYCIGLLKELRNISVLTIPNTFITGTTINAAPFNANFQAVATSVNSIDNSNIGAAGLFASQLIPTTAGQATFGGTVGYIHLAPSSGITPLTISGVGGQSVDILDVTATSGGAKYLFVSNNGFLGFGAVGGSGPGATIVQIFNDAGATNGLSLNVPTGSTNGYQFLVAGTAVAQITNNAHIFATGAAALVISSTLSALSAPATSGGGDLIAQRTASAGNANFGGASSSGTIDWNINTASSFSLKTGGGGFAAVSGGAYTNASDAAFKSNIAPITRGLAEIMALKPSSFVVNETKRAGLGFIAQDVQAVLPELVSADNDGLLGVNYDGIIPVLVKAFQDYVAAHP